MNQSRVNWRFYATLAAVVPLSFILHEAAHWLAGLALGHDTVMGLNGGSPRSPTAVSASDAFLISAAGPAVTLLQGAVAFLLIRSRDWLLAYPVLFFACFMRFGAAVVSVMHPNDEARMSLALGWGKWALPALVVGLLFALTWIASRRLGLGWRTNIASYLLCSVAVAAVVFGSA